MTTKAITIAQNATISTVIKTQPPHPLSHIQLSMSYITALTSPKKINRHLTASVCRAGEFCQSHPDLAAMPKGPPVGQPAVMTSLERFMVCQGEVILFLLQEMQS